MSKKPVNTAEIQLTPERIKFLTEAATKLCAAFIGIRNFDDKDAESRRIMSQKVRLAEASKRKNDGGVSFAKSQHQTARTILSSLSDEDREILRGSKMIMDLANACGFANAKTNFLFSPSPVKPYKVKAASGRIIDDSLRLAITNIAKNPIEPISVDRSKSPLPKKRTDSELSVSKKAEPVSREPIPVFKLKKSQIFSGIPLELRSSTEAQRPKTAPSKYSSLTITIPPTPDYIYSPDYFTSPLAAKEKAKAIASPIAVNNNSESEASPLVESETAVSLSDSNSVKSFDSDSTAISIADTPPSRPRKAIAAPKESEREVIRLKQLDRSKLITRTAGDSDSFHYARHGLDQLLRDDLERLDKETPGNARDSIRIIDKLGNSILHLAAGSGSAETVELILSNKYKPKTANFINLTNDAGKIATESGYKTLAQIIIDNSKKETSALSSSEPSSAPQPKTPTKSLFPRTPTTIISV